jgi:cytochrome b561
MLKNGSDSYGLVSKLLHWTVALLILGLVALGAYMVQLGYYDSGYYETREWHKSLGIVVLVCAALFVGWKAVSPSPPLPATMSRLQRGAANGAHHLLYLMMFVLPVTGYIITTAEAKPVPMFGLFSIPAFFVVSDLVRDIATEVHEWCAYGTAALAAGHAGAALKHQFIDRDGILSRMLWR